MKWIVPPVTAAMVTLIGIPFCQWVALASKGHEIFLWLPLCYILAALVAAGLSLVSIVAWSFRKLRKTATITTLTCISFCAALPVALKLGQKIRMREFANLAERSKPLINAVRAYEKKYARPPESLRSLVPEFLTDIPNTGMGAYPNYSYSTNSSGYLDNPWVIYVFTPSGGINFDQFLYFPLTNYPSLGFGGWLERVGDWAYVHE